MYDVAGTYATINLPLLSQVRSERTHDNPCHPNRWRNNYVSSHKDSSNVLSRDDGKLGGDGFATDCKHSQIKPRFCEVFLGG